MRFLPLVLLLLFVPLAFLRPVQEQPAARSGAGAKPAREGVPTRSLEAILPPDAALVLVSDDWDALRERAAQSEWVRLLADESSPGAPRALLDGLLGGSSSTLARLGAALDAVHGACAFFLVPAPRRGFCGGILLQPFGGGAELDGALRALLDEAAEGASFTREPYADSELVRIEKPGSEEVLVSIASDELVAMLFAPDQLSADELAYTTIDRRRGAAEDQGFAGSALYASATPGPTRPALALHADVQRLADALRPGWRRAEGMAALEEIGLSRIGWIHAALDLGAGEALDVGLELHLPPGSLLAGLAQRFRPAPLELVAGFPDRSLGVGAVGYDVAGAFETVRAFLAAGHPEARERMERSLQAADLQLGIDLEHDVIAQLTGRFASFSVRVPAQEVRVAGLGALAPQGSALFVELRDPTRVRRALERVLVACELEREILEQDCEGKTVSSLSFPGFLSLHWAFTDRGLFASQQESALLAALRRDGPLGGLGLARLRKELGQQPSAAAQSVVDTRSSIEAFLTSTALLLGRVGLAPFGDGTDDARERAAVAAEAFHGTLSFRLEPAADRLAFRFQAR